jgi:hypothetical protein
MRVLVAGRNAKVLAQVAGAFANDLSMATATTKAAAFALLDHTEFDLVVACEKLGDGSGLEVLSQVAVNTPNTLRIFAARPATLEALKGELGLFGLFRTLPYPISFRTLWAAINLARGCFGEEAPHQNESPTVQAVRMAKAAQAAQASPPAPAQLPHIRHVVLDADWDTTTPLPVQPVRKSIPTAVSRSAPRRVAPPPPPPTRIPESENFKRALARRKHAKGRQEPSVTNESLAQLAQLPLRRKPTYGGRQIPGRRKRTALFVGSGVFAAGAVAVLTFFVLGSNNSMGQSSLPVVASIDRPIPDKVLPWQTPPPSVAEAPRPTFVPSDGVTPAAAEDMQVEGEAASEQQGVEPDHPGPPPPQAPPGPSEPPQYDASGMPIQE